MFEVEYFTLTPTDASNRYISLSGVPVSSGNVAMDTIGGTAQSLNGDFGVDGTKIKWDDATNFALYNQLSAADNIRIIYDRS
jgi:hypothetical protein